VTIRLAESGVGVVLLDIEGTTTPIAFVHDELFPFARARLGTWIERERDQPTIGALAGAFAAEYAAAGARGDDRPPGLFDTGTRADISVRDYAHWLMDRDRKSPALKELQGLIWEEGYRDGLLRGVVYDDVPDALRRWRTAGLTIAIYSSGSELAQRRLFASTVHGDLTPLIDQFFDTRAGAKNEPASYRTIATALRVPADRILFVSDVTAELAAARAAGCRVVLSVRPGTPPQPDADAFDRVDTFASLA
jgi:enolase-phosphatase E1